MAEQTAHPWKPIVRRRAIVLLALIACWTLAAAGRLVWLQVYQRAELQRRADRQMERQITVAAPRGLIVDRDGIVLARSVDEDSIYADPSLIKQPDEVAAKLCAALGDCDGAERAEIGRNLRKPRSFVWIRRFAPSEQAARVLGLKLVGVSTITESRRRYPHKELAAPVIGYVGAEGFGLGGLERTYDKQVHGRDGKAQLLVDAKGRAFSRLEEAPSEGASLELTLDLHLQHIAERELRAGVAENRAAGGTAIVMDPHNGEILAMASLPTFNPNSFSTYDLSELRNRAVQDVYEPGSTFKVVTAAAGIEERVIRPSDIFDVSAGSIRFGSRVVSDVHAYGVISFTDVIVKSSNVGAIKAGFRIGAERLGRYVRRFGFGTRLSPDLPGESCGIVWPVSGWSEGTLASVSMGYEISVTPLQMVTAVSSVANGGDLYQPRVVRAIIAGGRRTLVVPKVLGRTVTRETAAELTALMEGVVDRGTGTAAQLVGYTVAGKTGTSKKLVNGAYSSLLFYSSFVGFVPSQQPALAIIVVIDSPRAGAYYGGAVAAPIFRRIAEASLQALGIGPTLNPVPSVVAARTPAGPVPVPTAVVVNPPSMAPARTAHGQEVLPDVTGLGAREAVRLLAMLGVAARVGGDGIVVEQEPPAGTPLVPGLCCHLLLRRVPGRMTGSGSRQ